MTTVIVGKNSFLAKSVQPVLKDDCIYLSHAEAFQNSDVLKSADIVINFAFDHVLTQKAYSAERDIDLKLAAVLSPNAHYYMMSSRMVYGDAPNIVLKETDVPSPVSFYGKAKLETEKALTALLGERLTILRLANIFGHEKGRKTFFGAALKNLSETKIMSFDIAPSSVRDFLAVWHFAAALALIVPYRKTGVFNLGSGYGTSAQDIANALIEGYSEGEAVFTAESMKGQFILDMTKTRAAFGLAPVLPETLWQDCVSCSRNLRIS